MDNPRRQIAAGGFCSFSTAFQPEGHLPAALGEQTGGVKITGQAAVRQRPGRAVKHIFHVIHPVFALPFPETAQKVAEGFCALRPQQIDLGVVVVLLPVFHRQLDVQPVRRPGRTGEGKALHREVLLPLPRHQRVKRIRRVSRRRAIAGEGHRPGFGVLGQPGQIQRNLHLFIRGFAAEKFL